MRLFQLLCTLTLVCFTVSIERTSFKLVRKDDTFVNYCAACLDASFVTYANYYQNDEVLMALPMQLLSFPCNEGINLTVGCQDACIRIEIFKNYDGLGRTKEGSLYDCSTGIYRKHDKFPQNWNFTNVKRAFGITHQYPGKQITMVYDYYLNNKRFWFPKIQNPVTQQINKMAIENAFDKKDEFHWMIYPTVVVFGCVLGAIYVAIINLIKGPKVLPFEVSYAKQENEIEKLGGDVDEKPAARPLSIDMN